MWLIGKKILFFIPLLMASTDNLMEENVEDFETINNSQPLRIQPRIWHGNVTANGVLGGFLVQIFYKMKLICTGTLLSERHFLTSAHCFDNLTYSNFHVVAGESLQRENFLPKQRKNFLMKLKIHPDYEKFSFLADLAVVKTQLKMKSKYIGYAGICSVKLFSKDILTVAGWGQSGVSNGPYRSNPLRSMKVSIVSLKECEIKLERKLPPNILCAGGIGGQTICNGDSGGPLIFRNQVCGVSTWTWQCNNTAKPDVYMSVLYYAKFIKQTIKDLGN